MAFSGNFMCTSFKQELLEGKHNFQSGGHTFKLALYTSSADGTNFGGSSTTMNSEVTTYATNDEVSDSGSGDLPYEAGGGALTNVNPTASGTTAYTTFNPSGLTFTNATITARGALIYNTTTGGGTGTTDTVCVLDFVDDKTSTAGDFQIVFPTADASTAIIRIA